MTELPNITAGDVAQGNPAQITAKAGMSTTATTTDSRGRKIAIKKLSPLDRMRLFKLLGADGSQNPMLFGYAALAASVTSIDGVTEHMPTSEAQLYALVERLGDEGLDAIAEAHREHFGAGEDNDADRDAIKN